MNNETTNIALVDDHILLRNGLSALINSFQGYHVLFEADNGKHFTTILQQFPPPDIVLLDITMPEMDGFETADWIKQHIPATKILVLSMTDHEETIITMLKKGAGGYILKDSKPRVFKQALDDIRDKGFFLNELVGNKMLNYVTSGNDKQVGGVISQLSENEIIFLKFACSEKTYKEIAIEMKLSVRTVEGYRDNLFEKLEVTSRTGLVLFAIRSGLFKL
jgi:DNA-binding NarL/FixJ family response regulator